MGEGGGFGWGGVEGWGEKADNCNSITIKILKKRSMTIKKKNPNAMCSQVYICSYLDDLETNYLLLWMLTKFNSLQRQD